MIPAPFSVEGSLTQRQQRALTKVFKACSFNWSRFDESVTIKMEDDPHWGGALYFMFENTIKIKPATIGFTTDKGRMRIAVSSIIHEIGHGVDDIVLTDEMRAEIKASFVCPQTPCPHMWKEYRYLDRISESFADAFVAAFTPVFDEMRPVDRTHKFNKNTLDTIRRVLA